VGGVGGRSRRRELDDEGAGRKSRGGRGGGRTVEERGRTVVKEVGRGGGARAFSSIFDGPERLF